MAALRIRTDKYVELEKDMYVFQIAKDLIDVIKEQKSQGFKKFIVDIDLYQGPTDFSQVGYRPFTGMTPVIYNDKVNKIVDSILPGIDHQMITPTFCMYYWR